MGQYQAPHQLMRLAQVISVNTVAATIEVVFADGMGRRNDIQVGWPFFSTNSWIRTMPEIGALVWLMFSNDGQAHIIGYHNPNYKQISDAAGYEANRGNFLFKPLMEGEIEFGNNAHGFTGVTSQGRVYHQSGTVLTEYIRDDQEHRQYAARHQRRLPNNLFMDGVERGVENFGEVRRQAETRVGADGDENIVYYPGKGTTSEDGSELRPFFEHYMHLRWDPDGGEGPELFQIHNGHVIDDTGERLKDPFYESAGSYLRKKEIYYTKDNKDEITTDYNDLHGNIVQDIPGQIRQFIGYPKDDQSDDTGSEIRSEIKSLAGGRKELIGYAPASLTDCESVTKSMMDKDKSMDGKFGADNVAFNGPYNYGPVAAIGMPSSVFPSVSAPSPISPSSISGGTAGGGAGSSGGGGGEGDVATEQITPIPNTFQTAFKLPCMNISLGGGMEFGSFDLNTGARARVVNFGDVASVSGGTYQMGTGGISTTDRTEKFNDGNNVGLTPPSMAQLMDSFESLMAWPYMTSGPGNTTPNLEPCSNYQINKKNAEFVYGKDKTDGKSLFLNTEGSVVQLLGKDNSDRSMVSTLLGGAEIIIGSNQNGDSLNLYCKGNLNLRVDGDYTEMITGSKTSIVLSDRYQITTYEDLRFAYYDIIDLAYTVAHIGMG
jgi:hypothetical protein